MANLKYLDIGQCLLLLVEIMRHILDSPNNSNNDAGEY